MASSGPVFWMDTDYDQANASDGVSRFAAYVRQAAHRFAGEFDCYEDATAAVAAWSWNTACPPVMSPGFVAWHPRVLSARAERDDRNGDLLLTVAVISALPQQVARAAGWPWQSWRYDGWSERFSSPELRVAGRDKALLPTVTASVLIPAVSLPTPAHGVPDWREAAEMVRGICSVLNGELGPIVAALDGAGDRRG